MPEFEHLMPKKHIEVGYKYVDKQPGGVKPEKIVGVAGVNGHVLRAARLRELFE